MASGRLLIIGEAGRRLIIVPKCEVLCSYNTIGHRGYCAGR